MTHPNVAQRRRMLAQWCHTHPLHISPQLHQMIDEFARWTPIPNQSVHAILRRMQDGTLLDADEQAMYGPIVEWDTSRVTSMAKLFCHRNVPDIKHWDTSAVLHMDGLFAGCRAFNVDISSWDTSAVVSMDEMFMDCEHFNQPIDRWNVSRVKTMSAMFFACRNFNQPVGQWDVSRVVDMRFMFNQCSMFNQPLQLWNIADRKSIVGMLRLCKNFNQPLVTDSLPSSVYNGFPILVYGSSKKDDP